MESNNNSILFAIPDMEIITITGGEGSGLDYIFDGKNDIGTDKPIPSTWMDKKISEMLTAPPEILARLGCQTDRYILDSNYISVAGIENGLGHYNVIDADAKTSAGSINIRFANFQPNSKCIHVRLEASKRWLIQGEKSRIEKAIIANVKKEIDCIFTNYVADQLIKGVGKTDGKGTDTTAATSTGPMTLAKLLTEREGLINDNIWTQNIGYLTSPGQEKALLSEASKPIQVGLAVNGEVTGIGGRMISSGLPALASHTICGDFSQVYISSPNSVEVMRDDLTEASKRLTLFDFWFYFDVKLTQPKGIRIWNHAAS